MKRLACVVALATGTALATSMGNTSAHAMPAAASGLQVSISTPGTVTGDSSLLLDVMFKGGNLRSIELHLDGQLVKKQQVRTQGGRGIISITLDGVSEGSHEILIKATDLQGNVATSTTRVKVLPGEELTLARIVNLKADMMVKGVVPIQLDLDPTIRNPYITFLMDNEFLAFINLAPYTYNWDSTRVPNGTHSLGVEVYDGETLAKVKTLSLRLNVNNPGGFTERRTSLPEGTNSTALPNPVLDIAQLMSTPITSLLMQESKQELARAEVRSGIGASALRTVTPRSDVTLPGVTAPTPTLLNDTNTIARPDTARLSTGRMGNATMRPYAPAFASIVSNPDDLNALMNQDTVNSAHLARVALRPRRAGNIASRPGQSLGATPAAVTGVAPLAVKANIVYAGLRKVRRGAFEVKFNGDTVPFDVPTRVEKGIPLAPFRQIFQHTGGEIQWYERTKTVRAVNSTHEIQFQIGNRRAKVNNQTVKMETKPTMEDGRAIVPMSFIREAMDVTVNYDPHTGRLVIESKK